MRGTALLLVLGLSASTAMGQAAVESGIMSPRVAPPIRTPQLPRPITAADVIQGPSKAPSKPQRVDSQFDNNVETLIALSGVRDALLENRDKFAEADKQVMLQKHPEYDPEFADAVAQRVAQRLSVDDFLNVVVEIYEKHYTNQDVQEMLREKQGGPAISARMKAKMNAVSGTVQSEIASGFAEVGGKLSAQIGQDLLKQHPEWLSRRMEPFVSPTQAGAATKPGEPYEFATVVPAEEVNSPNFWVTPAN